MAGLGFKDFAVGEVLTSANVDGYLMQQTVMRFADSAARGSALGTATGTAVPLAEGMVTYLDDVNRLEMYTGSTWITPGGFSASTAITATDASWSVPTLADPVVRVTVIGGGGGGGNGGNFTSTASSGTQSSFACSAGTAVASGGAAGHSNNVAGVAGKDGFGSGNGGTGAEGDVGSITRTGGPGQGGAVTVAYFDLTGVTTASVTVGAGGNGGVGTYNGGSGGRGEVIVEYRAG